MPLVSVIVPAYNAEDTIQKTINDILSQTYENYELIIVDDGSVDKTSSICDEYCAKYSNVRVIHQLNGGPSIARNNGIKEAKGDYVTFVDSDDRIDSRYLELLVKTLIKSDATLVVGQIDRIKEKQELFFPVDYSPETVVLSQKESLKALGLGTISVGPVCKLIKKEHCLKHPFLEGKYYEDLSNTYRIILENDVIALIKQPLYHYSMRGGSITGRKKTTKKQCLDYYEAILLCEGTVVKHYPDLRNDAAILKARDYLSLYLTINRCDCIDDQLDNIRSIVVRWIKESWRIVVSNTEAPVELRMRIALFAISPSLYSFVYYIAASIKGKRIK